MGANVGGAWLGSAGIALVGLLAACNSIAGLDDLSFSSVGAGAAGGTTTGGSGPGGGTTGGAGTGGSGSGAMGGGGGGPSATPGELLCSIVFPEGVVRAVAAAPQGGFVIGGWQPGGIDLGGGAIAGEGFVASFGPSCEHIFSVGIDGAVENVAVADDGSTYIAGDFLDTVTFGNDAVTSAGSTDMFISRLDGGGDFQWTRTFGGVDAEIFPYVDVDASGVYFGALFEGSFDVGPTMVTSQGSRDVLVGKLDHDGNVQWATTFGGPGEERLRGVKVDSTGAVVVAGLYKVELTFGGFVHPGVDGRDTFVVKLDSQGNASWSRVYGSQLGTGDAKGNDYACGLALRSDDSIVVSGHFTGLLDLGNGVHTANGDNDVFLLELTSAGNTTASRQFGGGGSEDRGCALAVAPEDGIVLAGVVEQQADFGKGPIGDPASLSLYALYLEPTGATSWAEAFGAGASQAYRTPRAAVDTAGNMLVAGRIDGPVDFGKGPVGGPGRNGFLVKLAK